LKGKLDVRWHGCEECFEECVGSGVGAILVEKEVVQGCSSA